MDSSRLPGLDLVRVLSVFFIILSHAGFDSFRGIGVPFLLALSGFLITKSLLLERINRKSINITKFWKNRLLRIAPAYYTFLIAVFILDRLILGDEWNHGLIYFLFSHSVNYFNAIHGHAEASGAVAHLWTLSAMEQFYLIYPFVLILALKSRYPILIIVVIMASSAIWRTSIYLGFTDIEHIKPWIYNSLDTRLDSLLIGCLMAFALVKKPYEELTNNSIAWLFLFIISFLLFSTVYKMPSIHFTIGFAIEGLLSSIMILSIMKLSEFRILSFFNSSSIRNLAKITYPMYLYHPIGLAIGAKIFDSTLLILLTGLFSTIVIATVSYQVIERRFIHKRSNIKKGAF